MSEKKTIFEGLYQIDWSQGGIYSSREGLNAIPDAIRELLSQDENVRQSARGFLFGEGAQEYGMIVNTTPYVAQFVFELVSLEETPEREGLLRWIAGILHDRKSFNSNREIKKYVAVYELAEQHLPLLLSLLRHFESDIREQAAYLLGTLDDCIQLIVPELVAQFRVETYLSVQVGILEALEDLFKTYNHRSIELRNQYRAFFCEVVETHSFHQVRYAAACAGLFAAPSTMFHRTKQDDISPATSSVFVDEFWQSYDEYGASYAVEGVLLKLILLPDHMEKLWQILNDDRLSGEARHTVLKSLIFAKFSPSYKRTIGPHLETNTDGYFYQYLSTQHRDLREDFLKDIVDNDLLWQQPTNLFSYFLGLPDSRDELRAFLESDKD